LQAAVLSEDNNLAFVDFYLKRFDIGIRREAASGPHVELPAVERTFYYVLAQLTLGQGRTFVWTDVFNCEELSAAEIKEGKLEPIR
jgi:hypothetical protein